MIVILLTHSHDLFSAQGEKDKSVGKSGISSDWREGSVVSCRLYFPSHGIVELPNTQSAPRHIFCILFGQNLPHPFLQLIFRHALQQWQIGLLCMVPQELEMQLKVSSCGRLKLSKGRQRP